jgi:predicted GNAT superfamily acetyltransferase
MINEGSIKFNRGELGKKIEVENASPHIERVLAIAQEARIDPKTADQKNTKKGFLVYPLDKERYEQRANGNDFFITFSEEGRVNGFLMCYERSFLQKLITEGEIGHEDGIISYLTNHTDPEDNFLYGDQICISAENRTREVGKILMETVFAKMKARNMRNMYVAILHGPIRNEASMKFVGRLGFENVAEVTNSDGLVWGIYHADISKV